MVPFGNGNFGDTDCMFGSGGILYDDSGRFVTSASTTDYLFYVEDLEQVIVSNSLPLILAYTKDALDPDALIILRCAIQSWTELRSTDQTFPPRKGECGVRCIGILTYFVTTLQNRTSGIDQAFTVTKAKSKFHLAHNCKLPASVDSQKENFLAE
jgi:hypothetical protein